MKLFKNILIIICGILSLLSCSLATAGVIWYSMPTMQLTQIGKAIAGAIPPAGIFWITIGCAILWVIMEILKYILSRRESSRCKNFFIHLNSYAICLVAIACAVVTFATLNPLVAQEVTITIPKKISIGVCIVGLVLFYILSGKLKTLINRRIQAYENAKEMNTVGRGSIIFTNFLKLFEIFFPEILVLGLMCLCLSWNVASYFMVILIASLIPMIGNIICDFNIRSEVKRKNELEKKLFAERVANTIKGD